MTADHPILLKFPKLVTHGSNAKKVPCTACRLACEIVALVDVCRVMFVKT